MGATAARGVRASASRMSETVGSVGPRSGAAGLEPLQSRSAGVRRDRAWVMALLDRTWDRLGGAELLLLLPLPLLLVARLHLHPRIDAMAAAGLSLARP